MGHLYLGNGKTGDLMTTLEMGAQSDGLQYIEELVFENGAVYKGKELLINSVRIPEGRPEARAWSPGVARWGQVRRRVEEQQG
jgi:hypothetical protein